MKVFTIAEGLENLGALRTGGQGSVYKTRRTGTIVTAVKMIPTPVNAENDADPNYRNFLNEVTKLQKVNEEPNPNVVKILSWGVTDSGAFPFIEMEYIEGPDLAELLKPPHDPVFSIKEAIKVADQLACALSHCHKAGVRHGDIKSNNVKFSTNSGNYVLLDFGLAVMSDEQRRSSLRHAGAVEFMAPEQNQGQMYFQTDVYSFGIVLYELLAGQVPFPLNDNGDITRNTVMLQHMEAPVPDLLTLRRNNIPAGWPADKKEREMQVPDWLLQLIHKCLQKNPDNRYASGIALHDAIAEQSLSGGTNAELKAENEVLKQKIAEINPAVTRPAVVQPVDAAPISSAATPSAANTKSSYKTWLVILLVCLAGSAAAMMWLSNASDKKEVELAKLRDSVDIIKQKAAKDSANMRKIINRLQVSLRTQEVIAETLRQDSMRRDSIARAGQIFLQPQPYDRPKPKKRKKFLGIF